MKFDPKDDIDLDPSEYWEEGKSKRFWTPERASNATIIVLAYPVYWFYSNTVGPLVRWLLESMGL